MYLKTENLQEFINGPSMGNDKLIKIDRIHYYPGFFRSPDPIKKKRILTFK